ncbi:MAG: tyrosine-type recombinase/integrase [Limisphaerales bacterium]
MKHRTGHLFRRGPNFYVRWTVEGKVFSKALRDENGNAITTKRQAEEARQKVMAPFTVADEAAALESIVGKLEGRKAEITKWEDEQNPPLPLASAWTEYLASPNRPDTGKDTLEVYQGQWSMFTAWMQQKHPERLTLRDVSKEIAEDYAATMNGGSRSPNTYNKHLNLLALVFRVLKGKAKIAENPWQDIPRKHSIPQSRRELTIDELKRICQSATGELRTLLALGIYSGLRLGDCATLRWGEVDLQRNLIRRVPSKTARRNPKPVIVPMHPVLRDMLPEPPPGQRSEYVLPDTAATYFRNRRALIKGIQRHFLRCGIRTHAPSNGARDNNRKLAVVEVGFHSLRHTFVSLCRGSNAPLAVVESIVGHSNPAMTRHYTHVGELAAGRAVAALPSVMGDAKPEPPKRDTEALLREINAIAESLTGENWREKKTALLALVKAGARDGQTAPEAGN